ncbi:major facilitator superfamily protein [Kipferlia bialata]|uniref:Major facilitator superfamily protein n=1 Tax=Kipferlia bialata TaxID=797122 RepID=A0A9K3CM06_9EUKA|nr:major facilitator superfamily protein [Kipferlia bialata]|eukprot:g239.t1
MHLDTLLVLACYFAVCMCATGRESVREIVRLEFQSEGGSDPRFSVMQITDTHLYEVPANTYTQLRWLVDKYHPGLIVLTGDTVLGPEEKIRRKHVEMCKFVTKVLEVPYMLIFGNHDSDPREDLPLEEQVGWREELLTYIIDECGEDNPLFLAELGVPTSTEGHGTDYVVPVYVDSGSVSGVGALVWAFDSHSHYCEGEYATFGCVEHTQAEWARDLVTSTYTNTVSGAIPPSLVFWHIPTAQWEVDVAEDGTATTTGGEEVVYEGQKESKVWGPTKENGIVNEILSALGNVYAISVGHQHFNKYCVETPETVQPPTAARPVSLCYGGKMGVTSYRSWDVQSGCRMFDLTLSPSASGSGSPDLSFVTFIVEEDQSGWKTVTEKHRLLLEPGKEMQLIAPQVPVTFSRMSAGLSASILLGICVVLVFIALVIYCVMCFHRLAPAVLTPYLTAPVSEGGLGISLVEMALVSSVFLYVYAATQPLAGILSDKMSLRILLALGSAVSAVGSLILSKANVLATALAGRVLLACGASSVALTRNKLAANWFSQEAYPYLLGVSLSVGGLGVYLASSPLESMLSWMGWRSVFEWNTIILAASGVVVALTVYSSPSKVGLRDQTPEANGSEDTVLGTNTDTAPADTVLATNASYKEDGTATEDKGPEVEDIPSPADAVSVGGQLLHNVAGAGNDSQLVDNVVSPGAQLVSMLTEHETDIGSLDGPVPEVPPLSGQECECECEGVGDVVVQIPEDETKAEATDSTEPVYLKPSSLWRLIMAQALQTGCVGAFGGFMAVTYFTEAGGYSTKEASSILGAAAIGQVVGGFVQSYLVNRMGEVANIRAYNIVGVCLMLILVLFGTVLPMWSLYILLFAMQAMSLVIGTMSLLRRRYPKTIQGTLFGILNGSMFVSAGVLQVLVGAIVDAIPGTKGYDTVLWVFVAIEVVGIAASWTLLPSETKADSKVPSVMDA